MNTFHAGNVNTLPKCAKNILMALYTFSTSPFAPQVGVTRALAGGGGQVGTQASAGAGVCRQAGAGVHPCSDHTAEGVRENAIGYPILIEKYNDAEG